MTDVPVTEEETLVTTEDVSVTPSQGVSGGAMAPASPRLGSNQTPAIFSVLELLCVFAITLIVFAAAIKVCHNTAARLRFACSHRLKKTTRRRI